MCHDCDAEGAYPNVLNRRGLLCCVSAVAGLAALGASARPAQAAPPSGLSADDALGLLRQGNRTFMEGKPYDGLTDSVRRREIAQSQHPIAAIIACSDSRYPPEVVFNQGLGELFIVRNAGNTLDPIALGSIEYAVSRLGVPLIMVLGHERCGAVEAAVSLVETGEEFPGAITAVVEPIVPAVLKAATMPGDLVDNAVRENIRRVVSRLKDDRPLLQEPLAAGRLKIVGARYDLDRGEVSIIIA
ncbi:carbonic anhydrase [Inquilinus sp. CA228]|uniref:carbonic anhydrase n=1 Tax=Inquilinus sp. CA228 TaxID=3455609 RepID=UPI003F8D68C2